MRMAQTNLNSRKILWKSSFDQQTMKSLDVPAVNKLEPQSNSMDKRFSSIDSKLDFFFISISGMASESGTKPDGFPVRLSSWCAEC